MKLMIATMIRGRRSSRSPSIEVVERRREREQQRRLDADPALERDGREHAQPLAADRQRRAARGRSSPSGSPGRVKTSGSAASMNGRAKNARREPCRNGPRWATDDSADDDQPGDDRARAYEPTGSRLTARMNAIGQRGTSGGRRRGGAGSRGRRSDRGPGCDSLRPSGARRRRAAGRGRPSAANTMPTPMSPARIVESAGSVEPGTV